ncbi:TPA: hypothetical protein ACGCHN_001710 [Stenotrophomonas maltophilia]|jgi:hypothetical protein|uniref:hypothetical protein n=1 Tax=Stenotrophomonas maltophilia TaxID=40324 RepID=UPI001304782E|nr:hypothetical protein [Stenotrophomonas maltophilia]QJC73946.1 hypothetical protein HGN30_08275 [Stenotrophomonas maltophilia]
MADRKHIECTNKKCMDGVIVEPPGSWYGAAVVSGDCEECNRLFQQDQENPDG